MTFRRFEDIDAWQTGRRIRKAVYAASKNRRFARDFGLRDQIRRAAISITANIAEGFAKQSDREFAKYLDTAKASDTEVQDHLYAALDEDYITEDEFKNIYSLTEICAKQLASLISYLLGRKRQYA